MIPPPPSGPKGQGPREQPWSADHHVVPVVSLATNMAVTGTPMLDSSAYARSPIAALSVRMPCSGLSAGVTA